MKSKKKGEKISVGGVKSDETTNENERKKRGKEKIVGMGKSLEMGNISGRGNKQNE